MTKNVYDLIVGICSAVDVLANTFSIYFLSVGKIDGRTAGVIADTTVSLTGIILGICSRYVTDDLTKKK